MYYNTPCPWLQVKLLRILQQFHANGALDADSADGRLNNMLNETLNRVLARTPPGKTAKNNAAYAVLIEAVNLVIARGKPGGDTDSPAYKLREQAVALLARFISVTEPNIRYVGLDSMYRMVRLDGDGTGVKQHQETVLFSLKDADPSVRRRALDLLFAMCDSSNAQEIVGELVNYLAIAERTVSTVPATGPVSGIREEIVLKAAILAEKYARDLRWYVDTVLQLLTIAGSEVPDAVWHRVVQIVTNREELQRYAAEQMFKAMEPRYVDETTTKFGAYVLGEFGYLLCDNASMSGTRQFEVLHQHYADSSVPTKGVLLTAFVKMDNLYEELRTTVHGVLAKAASNMNLEIQQRACEYLALRQLCQSSPNGEEVLRAVLEPMPVFPENRESGLIVRLRNQQKAAAAVGEGSVLPEEGATSPRAQARANEQPAASQGVDLLSLDEPVAPKTSSAFGMGASAEAIRGPNPASTDLGDIFGGGGSSGGKPIGLDASLTPQIAVWARNLMLNPQGVLVENDFLQIGAKHEYRGSQGRINLFFGNKTTHTLNNFSVQLATGNFFRVQAEEVPPQLAGKQQAKQQIMIEAMAPFTEPPMMTVSFSCNGTSYAYQMALPCQVTSFMDPVAVNEEAFLQRWNALEGQDREQQEVVPAVSKLDFTQAREWLSTNLKFAMVDGLDSQASGSLSGAATYRTGAVGPNGDKLSVGCLVRLEASDGNAYRIRVRAVHRDLGRLEFGTLLHALSYPLRVDEIFQPKTKHTSSTSLSGINGLNGRMHYSARARALDQSTDSHEALARARATASAVRGSGGGADRRHRHGRGTFKDWTRVRHAGSHGSCTEAGYRRTRRRKRRRLEFFPYRCNERARNTSPRDRIAGNECADCYTCRRNRIASDGISISHAPRDNQSGNDGADSDRCPHSSPEDRGSHGRTIHDHPSDGSAGNDNADNDSSINDSSINDSSINDDSSYNRSDRGTHSSSSY
ncbi:hypothetical protein ON010_g14767 [Phytophthora cinnamomi]|nr:hypothetical protein ON010_g14767 [Phytophthora cinnamomi]